MKVFRIDDSERHHFAARTREEALACYAATYEDEHDEADLVVTEIPPEDWRTLVVRDDDVEGGQTTIAAIMHDDVEGPAFLICSTVW